MKRHLRIFLTTALLTVAACTATAQTKWKGFSSTPNADADYQRSVELMGQGDYMEAAQLLRAISSKVGELEGRQAYLDMARLLKTEGNAWNQLGNKHQMGRVTSRMTFIVNEGKHLGLLNDNEVAAMTADTKKLQGNILYEEADTNMEAMEQAKEHFSEAITIYDMLSQDKDRAVTQVEMAELLYKGKHYDDALILLDAVCSDYEEWAADEYIDGNLLYDALSARAMTLARLQRFDEALNDISRGVKQYGAKKGWRFAEMLRKKAKIMMLRQEATGGSKSDALKCYKEAFDYQKDYALSHLASMNDAEREQFWMRMRPFIADCYRLEDADAAFLFDVTLFSKGLLLQLSQMTDNGKNSTEAIASLRHTWQQIQKRLQKDACAIEFVQYEKQDEQQMGALLLHKSGKPVFVKMAKPEEVMEHKIGVFTVRQRLAGEPNRLNQLYKDTAELQAKIWPAALVKAIGKDKKVYFSPAGFQNRIAIEYMLPAQLDGTDVYRLTSTRTLLYSKPLTDRQRALICGGISYEADIPLDPKGRFHSEAEKEKPTLNAQHSSLNDLRAFDYAAGKHMKFTYLPGSLAEADTIKARRNMKGDLLLTGSKVTEQQFCELAPKYPIVNISTHGFFGAASTPMGTDLKPCLTDESMSENFLVLAGANTNIGDENFDKEQRDGLLSALEMSALDLSEVELFVASACQSGSGYITADGVYGIQRGLKNAGVGAMVVSLFNVSDKATSIMLSNFQTLVAQGMPLHKAFMAARETLKAPAQQKKVYFDAALMSTVVQGGDDFNLPQYTNAFILIDAVDF